MFNGICDAIGAVQGSNPKRAEDKPSGTLSCEAGQGRQSRARSQQP